MRRTHTEPARSLVGHGDPLAAARISRVFGANVLRLEITRYLVTRDETSTADVMREFGLSRNGALAHLRELDAEGIVVAVRHTHPRGSGPITYWRVDPDEVELALRTLVEHVSGSRTFHPFHDEES